MRGNNSRRFLTKHVLALSDENTAAARAAGLVELISFDENVKTFRSQPRFSILRVECVFKISYEKKKKNFF